MPVPTSLPLVPSAPEAAFAKLAGLTVILPCYDEEPNVLAAVAAAADAAARHADAWSVVVVDDGSHDATGALAAAAAAADPRVRVVRHPENRGYGAAVRSGIAASQTPWILLTDGDLQFDLSELGRLVELAADHDLVAGFRLDRQDPAGRRAAAAAWNAFGRLTLGRGLRDVDCAFKLMRGDLARGLPLTSEGAMVSTELVVRARQAGWRIAEVGVHHRPRVAGEATGGDPRVILRAFAEHRRFARALRQERRAVRRSTRPVLRPRASQR